MFLLKYNDPSLIEIVLRKVPPDILVFIITDPFTEDALPSNEKLLPIFLIHYRNFIKDVDAKIQALPISNGQIQQDSLIELKKLPYEFHFLYQDKSDQLQYGEYACTYILNVILKIREMFKQLSEVVDYH